MTTESRFITLTEAARRMSVDRRTIGNWCREGKVPGAFQTPGGHWRVTAAWADGEYVELMDNGKRRGLHRLVMEEELGRPLERSEIVHHKDGDKRNNAPENLELMTKADHTGHHAKQRTGPRVSQEPSLYVPLPTAAEMLDVDRATVRRWIDGGKLPAFKTPGGHWRVRRVDVERVMREVDTFTVPEGALRTVCPFCGEPIEDGQETMVDARRIVHAECVRRIVREQSQALNGWARGDSPAE